MDALTTFAAQVAVMLLMLAGMVAGDYLSSFLFGGVSGLARRVAYTLLFVMLLALGSHIPASLGGEPFDVYQTALFYCGWGLMSVFAARAVLYSADFAAGRIPRPGGKKTPLPAADAPGLVSSLLDGGLSPAEAHSVLAAALGCKRTAFRLLSDAQSGRLRGFVGLNPCRLAAAVHRAGFGPKEAAGVLIASFGMSPEKAAVVWERSV